VARAYYPWQLSRISRLAPQTKTSIFCALCPHSCASEKDFPVSHPFPNRSGPSTLNPEFLWSEFPEKKLQLVDMGILLSPGLGCHNLTPPRRPISVGQLLSRNFPSWTRLCVQCRHMCHDGPHACAPDPHTPVLP
jgi:hypothetical protein